MASAVSSREPYIFWLPPAPYVLTTGMLAKLRMLAKPSMLAKPKIPRLQLTSRNSSEVSAVCAACGRIFHAYVRTCEKDAIVRLQRNFRLHARLAHGQVISNSTLQVNLESDLARTG